MGMDLANLFQKHILSSLLLRVLQSFTQAVSE